MNQPVQSDFINVRLSDVGRAFAGANGSVRIANAHMIYIFKESAPQRVLTSEWRKILAKEFVGDKPMFEVAGAPTQAAAAPTTKAGAPSPAPAPVAPVPVAAAVPSQTSATATEVKQ